MLPAEEAEERIGHAVGGVCPFAVNEGCDVYLDESLRRFDVVYPACGSSNSAIALTLDELADTGLASELGLELRIRDASIARAHHERHPVAHGEGRRLQVRRRQCLQNARMGAGGIVVLERDHEHPSELGTLYSLAELEELSALCRRYRIPLYLDGARLQSRPRARPAAPK